ncbi:MAG: single-stranded DNA-binding protein [Sporichthyaceae bacterium]
MRETYVTVIGNCVDQPRTFDTSGGALTKFRLAATPSFQRDGQWENGTTSFFEIACWRRVGEHVASSIAKGDPVIVHGKLEIREWQAAEGTRRDVQITANSVGHDLAFGIGTFKRGGRAEAQVPVHQDFDEENTEAA